MGDITSALVLPFIVLIVVVALLVVAAIFSKYYVKVGPNRAAFFYGARKGKAKEEKVGEIKILPPGTVVVTGGGRLRKPVIEEVKFLNLTEISIPDLKVENMPNIDGVLVTVEAVANIKFKSDRTSLLAAGERFLDVERDTIEKIARETLESNLRGVVGKTTVEQIITDRDIFRQNVLKEAGEDLSKLGMMVDVFNPQSITDKQGYIEALGKKRTAEVQRDAAIGEAMARKMATIESTNAHREAEVIAQDNLAKEAEARKEKDVKVQKYNAEVDSERARAEQAHPLSTARAQQQVVIEEVKVEEEKARAEISVEEQNILREQKAQEAETVVPAKAKADATVKEAEGYKVSKIARADGDRYDIIARAEAEQKRLQAEGEGEGTAIKAKGLSEAEVILKQGLAKAEALGKIADAYKQFNQAALLLELAKQMPDIVKEVAPVMGAIASPMGNIDRLVVVDSGGNADGKGGALSRYALLGPQLLFNLLEQAKALGVDISGVLDKLGVKVEGSEAGSARKKADDKKSAATS